ncbi:hypothetical protein ACLKA7_008718 [Drosophila subpalustris]
MSNVRCINFLDLCRICTTSSEQKINIYSPDGRAKNLSQKIAECLPVQIDEKDRLPKVVCAQCVHQVEQMYEMRNISKNSQTILSNWLNHRTLQTDDKVFIKDAINDAGKSLNVVGPAPSNSSQPNDLLSSIIQAVGMQVQQQPLQQQQQYTITVDSHVPAQPQPLPHSHPPAQSDIKSEKQNTLEEFIRLKPDIKITPLGKRDHVQSSAGSSSMANIKQQQQPHQQQQQHQPQQQLPTQTLTAVAAPAAQIQLQPQQLNELNVLLQQQALLQQLQQLQAQTQFSSSADDGSADKKPKLNFVLSSPAAAPQFAGSLQQFGGISGAQPQIQLQLLPGGGGSGNNAAAAQQTQQFNAAALLSSLTGTQVVGGNGAANMLSPNKCFLPITIRDENSDQQIVAHIDTKNLVLPTTYQVQMKLQPQLATADGQPIMQLTPTSIPATLQLTPQTLGNATSFQSASTTQQNQFLVPQPQQQHQQHQPQQQPQQQQQHQPQQQQPPPQQQQHHQQQQLPPTTAQVTSQQIIRSPRTNPINPQLIIRNVSSEPSTPTSSSVDASVKFKTPSPRQQPQKQVKYKTTPPSVAPIGGVAAASNNTGNAEFSKRVTMTKQQPPTAPSNVAALQRLSSNTTITKLTKPQQSGTSNKLPVLNKQNITISRISTQATPKPESKPAPVPAAAPVAAQIPSAPKPQQLAPPALAMQQLPQPVTTNVVTSIANQRKINRKPPEQQPHQRSKIARPQQQILPVPAQQTTTPPQQQQQQQQQAANTLSSETPAATPANALTCPTCRREFKKKEHLTQHVKLHAGLRPFKCTEDGCDKAFSRKEHLSRHLISHSGQKMFTCEECKKPFSRKDNLNKHKRTHTAQPGETRLHSCEICNKNFASKQHYEKHREMHKKSRLDNAAPTTQPAEGGHPAAKAQEMYEVKSATTATPQTQTQTQPAQSQMQIQQQQPQIMHVDLDGSTITITQASDSNMQTSLANFVQLGFSQFQNSSGPANQLVCKLEK